MDAMPCTCMAATPRIMRGLADYLMLDDQPFPCRINLGGFGQDRKEALQWLDFKPGHGRARPQVVDIDGPRRHGPEIDEILRREVELLVLRLQNRDGAIGQRVKRVVRLQGANKQVGIGQCGLYPVRIKALAADGFIGKRGRRAVVALGPGDA